MNRSWRHRFIAVFSLGLAVAAPLTFPAYVTELAFMWAMVVFALTWDTTGGRMGYNSFGNVLYFGIGMYVCAVVQREMYSHGIGEYATNIGDASITLTSLEYFTSLGVGTTLGALSAVGVAILLGSGILNLRGHYFAIATLGLGVAAAEIAGGIDFIGAGSGMVVPLFPEAQGERGLFYYYFFLFLALVCFLVLRWLYAGKFGLTIHAIRDDEDKAEAMGLHTSRYKTTAWTIAAFFLGIAGAGVGNIVGFIDPVDVAFAGSTFGVWMIVMAILGGKGTLWGPVIGAIIFHVTKELFWAYLLGWQRVALGLLIIGVVVFFPNGILGWMRNRWPERFGIRLEDVRETR